MYVLRSIWTGDYFSIGEMHYMTEDLSLANRFPSISKAILAVQKAAVEYGAAVGNFEIVRVVESLEVVE